MTGKEYQLLAARTIDPNMNGHECEMHALFGMASEVGELLGIFQKSYQGHEIDEAHVLKEVGDIVWFIAEFLTANHWSLDEVMTMNIDKLIARYPDGFDTEKSLHRKDGDV